MEKSTCQDIHDILLGSLTTQKILGITGQSDLVKIQQLVMKFDTRSEIGLGNIGNNIEIIMQENGYQTCPC